MAEEKTSTEQDPFAVLATILIIAVLIATVLTRLQNFITQEGKLNNFLRTFWLFLQGEATFGDLIGTANSPFLFFLFIFLRVLSLTLSVVLAWYTVSTLRKLTELNKKLRAPLQKRTAQPETKGQAPERYVNPKWMKVLTHFNSENPSDWKLAILEADIMLNEMLDKMGYQGETMSEKMKKVEKSDFSTIDYAWQAHKVRNSIAHEGSDFAIGKHEVQRVLGLYKVVFEEFKYI